MVGQSIHAAICSRLFRLFLASDLVLKQIHLASGLVLPYSLPNKSFKPSPLRGLGHTGPQRAGRLNSGVMRGRRRVFGWAKTFGTNRSPRGTAWKIVPTFGSRFGHTLA